MDIYGSRSPTVGHDVRALLVLLLVLAASAHAAILGPRTSSSLAAGLDGEHGGSEVQIQSDAVRLLLGDQSASGDMPSDRAPALDGQDVAWGSSTTSPAGPPTSTRTPTPTRAPWPTRRPPWVLPTTYPTVHTNYKSTAVASGTGAAVVFVILVLIRVCVRRMCIAGEKAATRS